MIGSDLFAALAGPSRDVEQRIYGLVIGVVTDNKPDDASKEGRVKVRFPWLLEESGEQTVSHWARVVSPMAGNGRGLYMLPEVDDEVLVAFEHGDVRFPYVLGALWNGKDTPPARNDDGKNNVRVLKSRSGHVVRLDDTEGKEKIEIIDANGKDSIVLDVAENTITITADKDVVIESRNGDIKLIAKGKVDVKGEEINLN